MSIGSLEYSLRNPVVFESLIEIPNIGLKRLKMKLVICLLVIFQHLQNLVYGTTIQIPQGELQGTVVNSIISTPFVAFKGIPYAKQPVGDLKFRDPLPAEPWQGKLMASRHRDYCPQPVTTFAQYTGNEACLYLNVYTPTNFNAEGSSPKSVMFWIFDGEFSTGSGDDNFYGADYLVAKDVVVVTINHRLGPLGFLNLDDGVITGNQGLKDQILALKWVRGNIAHFGGNPGSVTIFGAGSGAASAHILALSPMAEGLFHKVIAQSGTALNPWAYQPCCSNIPAEEIAASFGNSTKDPQQLLEFLKTIDATELATRNVQLPYATKIPGDVNFGPTLDDKSNDPLFRISLNELAQKGVKVPFLLGHVSLEAMSYVKLMDNNKWRLYNSYLPAALSLSVLSMLNSKGISVENIRQFYFGDSDISPATRKSYASMLSDLLYVYGIHDTVAIQVARNQSTYLYRFSYNRQNTFLKSMLRLNMMGVGHFEDVEFIFYSKLLAEYGFPAPERGTPAQKVVERMTQMWTDFAKTGDPTPQITTTVPIKWEPVQDANTFKIMDISRNLRMTTVGNINNRNFNGTQ